MNEWEVKNTSHERWFSKVWLCPSLEHRHFTYFAVCTCSSSMRVFLFILVEEFQLIRIVNKNVLYRLKRFAVTCSSTVSIILQVTEGRGYISSLGYSVFHHAVWHKLQLWKRIYNRHRDCLVSAIQDYALSINDAEIRWITGPALNKNDANAINEIDI